MSAKLALVTGVTGFIAGHVAHQLLEAGYSVRGTVRGEKAKQLSKNTSIPGLSFVQVDDIAKSDMTEALKDVDVLLHVASPLPGQLGVDETIDTAVYGTLNVLSQAAAAGIRKIVVTSSIAALHSPAARNYPEIMDESMWGEVTREEARENASNPFFVYVSSKILAERAVWDFARQHPELDIATILPAFVYGPYSPNVPVPNSPKGLGTNSSIYDIMTGAVPYQYSPSFVDVRDVARAHVLALDVPKLQEGGNIEQKRFIVNSGTFTWKQVAEHLSEKRPEIKTAKLEEFQSVSGPVAKLDTTRAVKVLGMTEWIDPRKTVDDTVDSLLSIRQQWN